MNRSFRAPESQQMQAAMKQRQQMNSLRSSVAKEKEEELSLFLEMRKREKEKNNLLLLQNSEEFDAPTGLKPGSSPVFNIASSAPPAPARKNGAEDFLNSENDKNDYDWLMTPPGTPLFPHLEMDAHKTVMGQIGTPNARSTTALKSRMANSQPEIVTRSNMVSRQHTSSPGLNSSTLGSRRPSSSGGPGSRPGTPTGRSTLAATSKPSRSQTPTSRPTLTASSKPLAARSTTPTSRSTARSSTPTSRSTATSATPTSRSTVRSSTPTSRSTVRSSTPTSRSTVRSSTPTSQPSIPSSKPTSRSATPIRRPSMPSTFSSTLAPPVKPSSSSVSRSGLTSTSIRLTPTPTTKLGPLTTSKNPVHSRGTSPTVKSRPWKPSEMPGFSHDVPPNLRTSVPPDRPLSASRGRPTAPSPRSSSVEPGPSGRPRRQSCSPSRGRLPNGVPHMSGSSVPAVRRHSKVDDNVSPVMMGTKMVERVINMRRLIPPRQDEKHSPSLTGKSASSPDSSGFGRNLSKKSIDMAIRHMDIRRSIPGNLRPLMTNVPASSMYSVRSGPGPLRSRTISMSADSPLATSSNASSEVSVNNSGLCLDDLEDEVVSDRVARSPLSLRGR